MADPTEQAERAVSALMRTGISLILPLWALAMVVLGAEYRSLWWLGTGLAVGGVGLLLFIGNPVASAALDPSESWRTAPPSKPEGTAPKQD